MPLVDPMSWAVLVFGDQNAWVDFLGHHDLWHRAFDDVIRNLGAPPFDELPLGDGAGDDWHDAHQARHEGEAAGLVIAPPSDFRQYDLQDPDAFATYTYLHALEHVRLRRAAGV